MTCINANASIIKQSKSKQTRTTYAVGTCTCYDTHRLLCENFHFPFPHHYNPSLLICNQATALNQPSTPLMLKIYEKKSPNVSITCAHLQNSDDSFSALVIWNWSEPKQGYFPGLRECADQQVISLFDSKSVHSF